MGKISIILFGCIFVGFIFTSALVVGLTKSLYNNVFNISFAHDKFNRWLSGSRDITEKVALKRIGHSIWGIGIFTILGGISWLWLSERDKVNEHNVVFGLLIGGVVGIITEMLTLRAWLLDDDHPKVGLIVGGSVGAINGWAVGGIVGGLIGGLLGGIGGAVVGGVCRAATEKGIMEDITDISDSGIFTSISGGITGSIIGGIIGIFGGFDYRIEYIILGGFIGLIFGMFWGWYYGSWILGGTIGAFLGIMGGMTASTPEEALSGGFGLTFGALIVGIPLGGIILGISGVVISGILTMIYYISSLLSIPFSMLFTLVFQKYSKNKSRR